MPKPKLYIHNGQSVRGSCGTLGMVYTLSSIVGSGLFDIEYHDCFFQTMRDYRATTVFYDFNGQKKKIYIDFWEYQAPTHTSEVLNGGFDLIVKLQHIPVSADRYIEMCRAKNTFTGETDETIRAFLTKIVPWSFFPSRIMEPYIGKEETLWNKPIERDGFFCGKDWRCRRSLKKWMSNNNLEYSCSRQDEQGGMVVDDNEFLRKMRTSKFGIIGAGRGSWATEGKNRREIDYMMLKKPLLLNYKPYYYFPMVEGEHYIYWNGEKLEDIAKKYDLDKIAENGYQWYKRYADKKVLGEGFKKILDDKFRQISV